MDKMLDHFYLLLRVSKIVFFSCSVFSKFIVYGGAYRIFLDFF